MLISDNHGSIPYHAKWDEGAVILYRDDYGHLTESYNAYWGIRRMHLGGEMNSWLADTNFDYSIYENGVRLCIVFSDPVEAQIFKLAFKL